MRARDLRTASHLHTLERTACDSARFATSISRGEVTAEVIKFFPLGYCGAGAEGAPWNSRAPALELTCAVSTSLIANLHGVVTTDEGSVVIDGGQDYFLHAESGLCTGLPPSADANICPHIFRCELRHVEERDRDFRLSAPSRLPPANRNTQQ